MPFFDFFRNIFSIGSTEEPQQNRFEDDARRYRNDFRNPIWQTDEEDDDVNSFRRPHRYQFRIFSDPFEMTRFFETQMDDMMKNFFGGFGFGAFGNIRDSFGSFSGGDYALPMPDDRNSIKGPRDEVLKPDYNRTESGFGSVDAFFNPLGIPKVRPKDEALREELLKPSYEMPDARKQKQDSDVDGKINSNELAKVWKSPESSVDSYSTSPFFHSFGSSVSTQIVRRPDGSIEQRKTVRDSNGNEEVRVTRQIGDKLHTVISKKEKDGSETKTEDIVNMNEDDLKGFNEKWKKIEVPSNDSSADSFPWFKFFGPNPKL